MALAYEDTGCPTFILMGRHCRTWTAAEDAELLAMHQAGRPFKEMAARLGRSFPSVAGRRRQLRLTRRKTPNWTRAEEARLVEMLEAHRSYAQIGRALGRSVEACQIRAKHLGIGFRSAGGYTLNGVARLMGVDVHTPMWWVREGWLRARRTRQRQGPNCITFTSHEALVAFLEDETHWHLWEPDRITDAGLREYATEIRRGLRFLTLSEAAPLLGVTIGGLNSAIRAGRIKGVKRAANWLIRSDWLIPWESIRGGWQKRGPLTNREREYIRLWWARKPATLIAREIGASDTTVCRGAVAMGLPRLGMGYWRRKR